MIPPRAPLTGPEEEPQVEGPSRNHEYIGPIPREHTRGDGVTRIVYINVQHFPNSQKHSNNELIRRFLDDLQADIVCFVEMNVNWKQVPAKDKLEYRTRTWWKSSRWAYSYNRHAQIETVTLYGGTAVLTIDDTTARIWNTQLQDPTGLGRWSGTRYRGRGQRTISVLSAYCPQAEGGPLTVASQHATYFARRQAMQLHPGHRQTMTPRKAFLNDLLDFIRGLQEKGDLVLLNMDANENLLHPNSMVDQGMYNVSLIHPMKEVHGNDLPNTWRDGTHPIDGMYMSKEFRIQPRVISPSSHALFQITAFNGWTFKRGHCLGIGCPALLCPQPAVLPCKTPQ